MSEIALVTVSLAFLMPLGYVLIAAGGLSEERARHVALSLLAAMGLAVLGYVAIGFALQFGGVGLIHERPGYEELIWEWSALGPMWGKGWGMAGLAGWGLTGAAATAGAIALAFANLPWVITATAIPLVSLRGRIPAWAAGLIGLLMGAVIFPLAGNWIWGGGWLANLGSNLGLGHGFVDAGGSGQVHLLGAAAALAGILVFTSRRPRRKKTDEPIPLPPVHLPILAVVGAGFLLVGQPCLDRQQPAHRPPHPESAASRFERHLGGRGRLHPAADLHLVLGRRTRSADGDARLRGRCGRRGRLSAVHPAYGRAGDRRRRRAADPPGHLPGGSPAALG